MGKSFSLSTHLFSSLYLSSSLLLFFSLSHFLSLPLSYILYVQLSNPSNLMITNQMANSTNCFGGLFTLSFFNTLFIIIRMVNKKKISMSLTAALGESKKYAEICTNCGNELQCNVCDSFVESLRLVHWTEVHWFLATETRSKAEQSTHTKTILTHSSQN